MNCLIRRAIVNDDELEIRKSLAQDALDGSTYIPFPVVYRHDNADKRSSHDFQRFFVVAGLMVVPKLG